jgi:hypothetical protein
MTQALLIELVPIYGEPSSSIRGNETGLTQGKEIRDKIRAVYTHICFFILLTVIDG